MNENASHTIQHERNRHLWPESTHGDCGKPDFLVIGGNVPRTSNGFTIATFGRAGADVYVEAANPNYSLSVSKMQCSIETSRTLENCLVIFDRSLHHSTQLHGDTAYPFREGQGTEARSVAMMPGLNTQFGFGGRKRDLFLFEIVWPNNATELPPMVRAGPPPVIAPDMARTIDPVDEDVTPEGSALFKPYSEARKSPRVKVFGEPIGAGSFGTVWRAVDVDRVSLLAVKIHRKPDIWSRREACHLSQLSHVSVNNILGFGADSMQPHIVEYLGSSKNAIYMELMNGSLTSLAEDQAFKSEPRRAELAGDVFEAMIQALDYIANAGIIHRDIKPDNIFYKLLPPEKRRYKLGDFGLSNGQEVARTYVGSPLYMAPEICDEEEHRQTQTHKADVWSLFVTIMWILDIDNFRRASYSMDSRQQVYEAIRLRADNPAINSIRDMAEVNPDKRASAADMIATLARRRRGAPRQVPPLPAGEKTITTQVPKPPFDTAVRDSENDPNTGVPRRCLAGRQQRGVQNYGIQPRRPHQRQRKRSGPRSARLRLRRQRQNPLGTSSATPSTRYRIPGAFPERLKPAEAKGERAGSWE